LLHELLLAANIIGYPHVNGIMLVVQFSIDNDNSTGEQPIFEE
jgi:hypothetical protein